jgi:ubiquinone/menaquinone biosynthesis C-methylase UbiE
MVVREMRSFAGYPINPERMWLGLLKRLKQHLETLNKTVYSEPKFPWHESIIDSAFEQFVNHVSFKKVLDVGFGTGYSLEKFRKLGIDPIGITLDNNELQCALLLKYNVFLMDMADLDFDDGSFELVWCRHTLEHSVMPLIALMEFNRVLESTGYLYVEVPTDNVMHVENPNHYSLFNDSAWQALFRKAGFNLVNRGQVVVKHPNGKQVWHDFYWSYWLRKQ